MSKSIDDINRKILADNERARNMDQLCVEGDIREMNGTEPTNAEHDSAWWIENANVNDAEDCEACEGDLCPVHHGIAVGFELVTKKIAALGNDPELFALIPDPLEKS